MYKRQGHPGCFAPLPPDARSCVLADEHDPLCGAIPLVVPEPQRDATGGWVVLGAAASACARCTSMTVVVTHRTPTGWGQERVALPANGGTFEVTLPASADGFGVTAFQYLPMPVGRHAMLHTDHPACPNDGAPCWAPLAAESQSAGAASSLDGVS